jgi:epoxide hydrolase-like predicted phosphatase
VTEQRALIVDLGGVLTTPMLGSFTKFCEAEQIELEDLKEIIAQIFEFGSNDHPIAMLETGQMEAAVFDAWLAAELGGKLDRTFVPDGIGLRLVGNVTLDERMFAAVAHAKEAGVKTGLLSNSWGNTDYGELPSFFDIAVISGAEGMRKPNPEIYELAAERLGLEPSACIFVDDVAGNAAGARAIGMQAVHHTDVDATLDALEAFLGVDLR